MKSSPMILREMPNVNGVRVDNSALTEFFTLLKEYIWNSWFNIFLFVKSLVFFFQILLKGSLFFSVIVAYKFRGVIYKPQGIFFS